ncbi:hypothetical protein ANCCEY_00784 [Ancylostoma ceylanicum]|uniref:Uncharacterized protein n=1 Tax=Ancylostoma ceylanicum TaxID=53326 RepID=A0A0D6MB73_9BILA|nr:hypothetical protein ANCCEY_00784 [Ancylostoma ceylanicum]
MGSGNPGKLAQFPCEMKFHGSPHCLTVLSAAEAFRMTSFDRNSWESCGFCFSLSIRGEVSDHSVLRFTQVLMIDQSASDEYRNKKNLSWINEEPQYTEFVPVGAKPYTLFKSIYTNNTNRPQEYSFKTERTTESLCSIAREQGYTMGAEAELTLKTPCTSQGYVFHNNQAAFR